MVVLRIEKHHRDSFIDAMGGRRGLPELIQACSRIPHG